LCQSVADFRIRSMMCAPLVNTEGKSLGVLQIDTVDQRKRFQPNDLEVVVSVAAQAGIAIDNAQMHENALRQQSLERDLQLAREVQRSFLPEKHPELDSYEFFDYYQPASHVGGDYFDYIYLPDGRIAVVVADVVGHGVAAALLMAKLSGEARYSLASEAMPGAAVTALNDKLSNLQIDRFVTLFLAVLNPRTHEVTMVNAGHMAPIYRHLDGRIEEPGGEDVGLPLGIDSSAEYGQLTLRLAPGESLTLYTDGVNEAMNERDECFGIERIYRLIAEGQGSLQEIGNRIIADVRRHLDRAVQADDMCLVCFRRR
jgi:serine phosphatase RsbU (regulator of sigma subunit)